MTPYLEVYRFLEVLLVMSQPMLEPEEVEDLRTLRQKLIHHFSVTYPCEPFNRETIKNFIERQDLPDRIKIVALLIQGPEGRPGVLDRSTKLIRQDIEAYLKSIGSQENVLYWVTLLVRKEPFLGWVEEAFLKVQTPFALSEMRAFSLEKNFKELLKIIEREIAHHEKNPPLKKEKPKIRRAKRDQSQSVASRASQLFTASLTPVYQTLRQAPAVVQEWLYRAKPVPTVERPAPIAVPVKKEGPLPTLESKKPVSVHVSAKLPTQPKKKKAKGRPIPVVFPEPLPAALPPREEPTVPLTPSASAEPPPVPKPVMPGLNRDYPKPILTIFDQLKKFAEDGFSEQEFLALQYKIFKVDSNKLWRSKQHYSLEFYNVLTSPQGLQYFKLIKHSSLLNKLGFTEAEEEACRRIAEEAASGKL